MREPTTRRGLAIPDENGKKKRAWDRDCDTTEHLYIKLDFVGALVLNRKDTRPTLVAVALRPRDREHPDGTLDR